MRPRLFLVVVAIVTGCASHRPERAAIAVDYPTIRLMTYNVNFGGPRMDMAIAAIAEANADIVCLQETTPEWERELRYSLSAVYPHMQFRHSGGAGGQAFLSKFPLQEFAYVTQTPGWFPGWIVKADTPIGSVQLVNVHLRPPLSESGSATPSAYLGAGSIHREEVRTLSEKLDRRCPALIMGDFNENDSGKALAWLRQHGFRDSLPQFDQSTNTWEWRTSVITLRGRYDHILYSAPLVCADARVLRRGSSDHFPLTAMIATNNGKSE